jgi:hypothetical protein
MCVSTVKVWDIGEKTVRSSTEPARIQLQQHILNEAPNISADTVNDKYFIDCNFFSCCENNVTEFEIFSEQINCFENSKLHGSFKGVQDNLKKHIQYWKDIGANEFILERTVFSPMSHTFTVETHIPGARLTPCKADTKGRLRSRTAHIIRIWIRTSF